MTLRSSRKPVRTLPIPYAWDITKILQTLVAQQVLVQEGSGRWTKYHLPASADSIHKTPSSAHIVPDSIHIAPSSAHIVPDSIHKSPDSIHKPTRPSRRDREPNQRNNL